MNDETLPMVLLVRHGETAWSLSGQHTGLTNIALSPRGEEQARQLPERLGHLQFTRVLTSPLQRARRTCELAGFAGRCEAISDLTEWNYGDYEGLTTEEIRKRSPNWSVFSDGCPGGESVEEVSHRADRIVLELRSMTGRILIFSHGHFLRVLASRWVGWPLAEARRLALSTASISSLSWEHNNPQEPVIVSWNC